MILYLYGLPVDKSMDGKFPEEIFNQEHLDQNKPEYTEAYPVKLEFKPTQPGEKPTLEKKLKDLGYL